MERPQVCHHEFYMKNKYSRKTNKKESKQKAPRDKRKSAADLEEMNKAKKTL